MICSSLNRLAHAADAPVKAPAIQQPQPLLQAANDVVVQAIQPTITGSFNSAVALHPCSYDTTTKQAVLCSKPPALGLHVLAGGATDLVTGTCSAADGFVSAMVGLTNAVTACIYRCIAGLGSASNIVTRLGAVTIN